MVYSPASLTSGGNLPILAKLQTLRQTIGYLNNLDTANPSAVIYSCLLQIVNILDELYVEKNGE